MQLPSYIHWKTREVVTMAEGQRRLDDSLNTGDLVTIAVSGFAAHPTFRQCRAVFLTEDGEILCHRSWWWYDDFEGVQTCLWDGTPNASASSGNGPRGPLKREQSRPTKQRAKAVAAGASQDVASDEPQIGEEQNDEFA